MRGRGELVEQLPDAPELELVLVKPRVGVSTAAAYAELDKHTRQGYGSASDKAQRAVDDDDRSALVRSLANDFDPVVSSLVAEVAEAKRELMEQGAQKAMLTGSGSAVFGVFESADGAAQAAAVLGERYDGVFACRSLARAKCVIIDE